MSLALMARPTDAIILAGVTPSAHVLDLRPAGLTVNQSVMVNRKEKSDQLGLNAETLQLAINYKAAQWSVLHSGIPLGPPSRFKR
jgi:hypothetical protein